MTELRRGMPVVVGDITIVPVEEVSIQSWTGPRGFGVSAFKRPVAILVTTPTGKRIFELAGDVPEFAQMLDRLS